MPIIYEGFGNILTHKAQTITCPVNTVGVMGAGLALDMKDRIKGLNAYYKKLCLSYKLVPGRCAVFENPDTAQQILLFPTKLDWRDNSTVVMIEDGLKYLVKHIEELKITELAIIPLGCGLGKLDYIKDIRPIMFKHLNPLKIDVHILHRDLESQEIFY